MVCRYLARPEDALVYLRKWYAALRASSIRSRQFEDALIHLLRRRNSLRRCCPPRWSIFAGARHQRGRPGGIPGMRQGAGASCILRPPRRSIISFPSSPVGRRRALLAFGPLAPWLALCGQLLTGLPPAACFANSLFPFCARVCFHASCALRLFFWIR